MTKRIFASRRAIGLLLLVASASAFSLDGIFQQQEKRVIKEDLLKLTDQQEKQLLRLTLNIGEDDGPRFAVRDVLVEMHPTLAKNSHVSLPGADGEHAKLSSGHRRLDVLQEGQFINLEGTQHVQMLQPCWEMCWRQDKPAGTLILGFDIPQPYQRNEALLPAGEIHLSMPVWTLEGLKFGQEQKRQVEERLEQYLEERDEALRACDATDNPLMKAVHIRNAFAATDKYNAVDHQTLSTIPLDHQVFQIQDDLFLSVKGLIWTKDESDNYLLLGDVAVSPASTTTGRLMP